MKTETVAIHKLSIDPANVRTHGSRNIEAIKASLLRFGQQKPIVADPHGVVLAGNGTLTAARELGWETIEVVRTELESADRVAFSIADNRTSELAEWDFEALGKTLDGLRQDDWDLNELGWADHEVEPLLAAEWSPPEIEEEEASGPEDKTSVIRLTAEQRVVVDRAIAKVREESGAETDADADCLVIVCEQFLGGG